MKVKMIHWIHQGQTFTQDVSSKDWRRSDDDGVQDQYGRISFYNDKTNQDAWGWATIEEALKGEIKKTKDKINEQKTYHDELIDRLIRLQQRGK